jgi:hypothetical protein
LGRAGLGGKGTVDHAASVSVCMYVCVRQSERVGGWVGVQINDIDRA